MFRPGVNPIKIVTPKDSLFVLFSSENLLMAQHLRETPVMPLPAATLVFIPHIFHPKSQACQSDQLPSVGYRLGGSKGPMTGPRQFI